MNILVTQNLQLQVAVQPVPVGAPITQTLFALSPADIISITDQNVESSGYFSLAPTTVDQAVSMGSIVTGSMLMIRPDADMCVKIVNGVGTSQELKFKGGRASILHMVFTGLFLSNPSSVAVTGKFCLVGV